MRFFHQELDSPKLTLLSCLLASSAEGDPILDLSVYIAVTQLSSGDSPQSLAVEVAPLEAECL